MIRPTGRWLLAIVAAAAIAIRLAYVFTLPGNNLVSPRGLSDATDYHAIAVNLLAGEGFSRDNRAPDAAGDNRLPLGEGEKSATAYRPPLYPVFMALIYFVTGLTPLAVRVAQSVLGGLTVLVVGMTALSISGSLIVALLAATFLALNPASIYFTADLFTETLFGVWTALVYWSATRPVATVKNAAVLGLAIGLAALTRPTALAFAPIMAAAVLHQAIQMRRPRPWWPAMVCVACTMAVTVPWMVRNTLQFGQLTSLSTNGGINLSLGISREWTETIGHPELALVDAVPVLCCMNEAQWDSALAGAAKAEIILQPARFLELVAIKWLHFFSPVMSDAPILRAVGALSYLPLVIGTALWWPLVGRRSSPAARRAYIVLVGSVLLLSLTHALYITNIRFRIPLAEPVFAIFAAHALWASRP